MMPYHVGPVAVHEPYVAQKSAFETARATAISCLQSLSNYARATPNSFNMKVVAICALGIDGMRRVKQPIKIAVGRPLVPYDFGITPPPTSPPTPMPSTGGGGGVGPTGGSGPYGNPLGQIIEARMYFRALAEILDSMYPTGIMPGGSVYGVQLVEAQHCCETFLTWF